MGAAGESKNLDVEVLKPFYQRASEAEDRLAKLESVLSKKVGDSEFDDKEVSSIIKDLQLKLEAAQAELKAEREKASKEIQKLETENSKLQYRVSHLIRSVKEAES